MIEAKSKEQLKSWRWGFLSLASWAVVVYVLIIAGFAMPRLLSGSATMPIYRPHEYVDGSYPLFWLVYIWIPLICRDVYVTRKHRRAFSLELKSFSAFVLIVSLAAYTWVFGWF